MASTIEEWKFHRNKNSSRLDSVTYKWYKDLKTLSSQSMRGKYMQKYNFTQYDWNSTSSGVLICHFFDNTKQNNGWGEPLFKFTKGNSLI